MLDEMKEAGGRSKQSGTVVKKKISSECLAVKKKVADTVGRNFCRSSKEKKRRRVAESEYESSDYYSSETSSQKRSAVYKVETQEFETEKRASSGLDVFEFDEYDGFDDLRSKKYANNRWQTRDQMETGYGGGSRRPTSSQQLEMEDDDFDLPLSALTNKYRSSTNQPIKLQGENGVLKVMVDKNKKEAKPRRVVVHKKKNLENGGEEETCDAKSKVKPKVEKSSKEVNESDTVMLQSKSNRRAEINVKKKVKDKESSGSEKQILREKIKKMLVGAGWSIDYRPRKDRNYMDAIYTNPAGTAYWSIIKAYQVLRKEEEDSGSFTPLPVEILGKLLTQKKIETELKTKRKVQGNDNKRAMEDTNSDEELDGRRKSRKLRRCSLSVRDSNKVLGNEDSGKRSILAWLIDSGVVNMSEHVEYMNGTRTRILGKGWITRQGIHCGCCSKIQTVLKFEQHSGSKLCNPFPNMFLESGKSLMQCQIDAWNKLGELEQKGFHAVDDGDDPNDDTCGVCGDGGDLICCDGCPSTFHQSCLEIEMLPEGDWLCPNCSCKYCEKAAGTKDGGQIKASLVTCLLCYKKYHESCRPGGIDVKISEPNSLNMSFCGDKCHEVYVALQMLVGVKHELDSGFSWSLIHRSDGDGSVSERGVECNSMLAVSMSVMDECFLPFIDSKSGINLIRNVVFNCGSNLSRLNYSGFYTAVLERGDEVVSAASIRFHGTQLAEMPFIGTRHIYRRQGMCRRLLSAIESALSALQVEKMIIPAVAEHMKTWTDVFGFQALEESHKQQVKCMNMLVFPGTDMLQKPPLLTPNPNAIPSQQGNNNTVEVDDGNASSKKPERISSNVAEFNGKIAIMDSSSQLPGKESDSIFSHSDSEVNEIAEQNENGTDHKEIPCGSESEMNRKEKERGTSDTVFDSEDANDLAGLHSCNNNTGEADDGLSKKPELISSSNMGEFSDNYKTTAVTDSGVQEVGKIHLDDASSLDPINSPVKDCEPQLQLPGKESDDSIHSHSDSKANEISERNGNGTNSLPSHLHDLSYDGIQISKRDSFSSVDVQTQGNNNIVEVDNGCPLLSRDTELTASDFFDKSATSDSSCQEFVVHLDYAIKETHPMSSPVEDESPCEPQLQLPGKEIDSIHSHSNSNSKVNDIAVQNGNGTNPLPKCVHDSSHDDAIQLSNKESFSFVEDLQAQGNKSVEVDDAAAASRAFASSKKPELLISSVNKTEETLPFQDGDGNGCCLTKETNSFSVKDEMHHVVLAVSAYKVSDSGGNDSSSKTGGDAHFESTLEAKLNQVPAAAAAAAESNSNLQMPPAKESHSYSDSKVDEAAVQKNGTETNPLSTQVDMQTDSCMVSELNNTTTTGAVSDSQATNNPIPIPPCKHESPCEPQPQLPRKESDSISHSLSDVQNYNGTDPHPTQLHDATTHKHAPSTEPKLQQLGNESDSTTSHFHSKVDEIAVENGNENADKDNIQLVSAREKGSLESEMNKGGISG